MLFHMTQQHLHCYLLDSLLWQTMIYPLPEVHYSAPCLSPIKMLDHSDFPLKIPTWVGSYTGAVVLARSTDLIATVPAKHTQSFRKDMHSFVLPFTAPDIAISMFWHPRMNADQAHRWLRETILKIGERL